ncbi:hypothetical protein M3Y95_00291400 [Aphelenchoides besseyi]|nr:hypothetical protein M3Y95_00291400 [Aphelenchoides besseyi]
MAHLMPVSALISTAPVAIDASEPEETTEQSKENLVMLELIKKPQLLYYDYKMLQCQFATLPVSIWANSMRCEVLVIRLDSPHWTGNIPLNGPVCRFTLSDMFGYFLVFAKPEARPLAQQFTQFTTNFLTLDNFMERVNEMNFRSSLAITNDIDYVIVCHLQSPRFTIL